MSAELPAAAVDLSTRQLRSFVAVAEELHFTRAAGRLFVTQQTLSGHISRIERRLGAALFERTSRQVVLTPAGEALLERAREALAALDEGITEARHAAASDARSLRLGFLPGAALELTTPIVAAFRQRCPGVSVQLVERGYDDPSVGLRDGSADVAFVRPPICAEGISLAPLFTERRVVAVGVTHPFASRETVGVEEILSQPLLAPRCDDPVFRGFWLLEDAYPGRTARVVAATASVLEELELVADGELCDITTEGARRFVPRPGVAYVPIEGVAGSELAVGWKQGSSPVSAAFVETALAVRDREVELLERITSAP